MRESRSLMQRPRLRSPTISSVFASIHERTDHHQRRKPIAFSYVALWQFADARRAGTHFNAVASQGTKPLPSIQCDAMPRRVNFGLHRNSSQYTLSCVMSEYGYPSPGIETTISLFKTCDPRRRLTSVPLLFE